MSAAQILGQLKKLPYAEQREVFEQLRDKFDVEPAPGEAELIDSRLQDHREHPENIVSAETVKARLDAKYGRGSEPWFSAIPPQMNSIMGLRGMKPNAKARARNFALPSSTTFIESVKILNCFAKSGEKSGVWLSRTVFLTSFTS